jgi:hypothetical protein
MAEPYWQITINASPYVTSRERVNSHERAMAKLYEAMKTLEYGQTLTLYHVDADGLVHPEYKITRQ